MTGTLPYARVVYEEEQRFRHPVLWVILLLIPVGVGLASVYALVHGMRATAKASAVGGMVLSFGAPLLMFVMKLETRLSSDVLVLRFVPFWTKRIRVAEIASCEARDYRPLVEYGGWGIRYGSAGWAYNVSGSRGVQLRLGNGQKILVGSQRADELAAAINDLRAPSEVG